MVFWVQSVLLIVIFLLFYTVCIIQYTKLAPQEFSYSKEILGCWLFFYCMVASTYSNRRKQCSSKFLHDIQDNPLYSWRGQDFELLLFCGCNLSHILSIELFINAHHDIGHQIWLLWHTIGEVVRKYFIKTCMNCFYYVNKTCTTKQ